jgi:hypothetical protein
MAWLPPSHACVSSGSQSRITRFFGAVSSRNRLGRSVLVEVLVGVLLGVLVVVLVGVPVVLTGFPPEGCLGPLRERVTHARNVVLPLDRAAVKAPLHLSHAASPGP